MLRRAQKAAVLQLGAAATPLLYRRALSESVFVYIQEGSVRSAGSTTMEPLNCKTVPVKMIAQPGLSERPGVAGRPGLQKQQNRSSLGGCLNTTPSCGGDFTTMRSLSCRGLGPNCEKSGDITKGSLASTL
ncbi:UNVERIFIED_CONTAM: hypothetical protein FKN15_043053 [Acipenser sinensis]